jgi:hypothetical protein
MATTLLPIIMFEIMLALWPVAFYASNEIDTSSLMNIAIIIVSVTFVIKSLAAITGPPEEDTIDFAKIEVSH